MTCQTGNSKIKPFRSAAYVLERILVAWLLGCLASAWLLASAREVRYSTVHWEKSLDDILNPPKSSHVCAVLLIAHHTSPFCNLHAPRCFQVFNYLALHPFLQHLRNHTAMYQSHVAKPSHVPQSCLCLFLLSTIFPPCIISCRTLALTMLHLQNYHWTSKTPLDPTHQAENQPHGLGFLLNRG